MIRAWLIAVTLVSILAPARPAAAADGIDFEPPAELAALDKAIDWSRVELLAVQHQNRYKTFDSFAREVLTDMTGKDHFPGLTPEASILEWMFNGNAYNDQRMIRIKDKGIRLNITAHMPAARADEIRKTGFITRNELRSPEIERRLREMATITRMAPAMGRAGAARAAALSMEEMLRIVPREGGGPTDPWHMPLAVFPNLTAEGRNVILAQFPQLTAFDGQPRAEGVSPENAVKTVGYWMVLSSAWRGRSAASVQTALDGLTEALPKMAPAIYPSQSQREAEQHYYTMGKFAIGWVTYFIGFLISIWAAVTRWKSPWWIALILIVVGFALHAYGIGLRWYILDRIPVANMFEAIVFAAWVGVALCVLLEAFFPRAIFLLGGHALGFTFLILATYVVPGGGTLSSIRVILDDVMLRIHTTMIIASYGLIFIASVIAIVYLFGFYLHRSAARSAEAGIMIACAGAALWIISAIAFTLVPGAGTVDGYVKNSGAAAAFGVTAGLATIAAFVLLRLKAAPTALVCAISLAITSAMVAVGDRDLVLYGGISLTALGVCWFLGNIVVVLRSMRPQAQAALAGVGGSLSKNRPALAGATAGEERGVHTAGPGDERAARRAGPAHERAPRTAAAGDERAMRAAGSSGDERALHTAGSPRDPRALLAGATAREDRPILAGAMPGDEGRSSNLPRWLVDVDWMHLIILNIVFVLLFVGIILGAVWADYSWGRPWGWDPKEVFAMNTWLIYAILIHARFATKSRGLATAWLSVIGCLMMAFNWVFVNFYIVGLHSYA
ncbi:MAG: cytochrome c biogenesis protein CcsA [Phycisphaerales bacterium]|nr:cytochrome c biogenesis protein CcsA [Phycisphaerales bacterium]